MYTFVAGSLAGIAYLENYLINTPKGHKGIQRHYFDDKDSLEQSKDAYFLGMEFFFYKGSLYNAIFGLFLADDAPNQAMAKYQKDSLGNWVFGQYANALPDNYITSGIGYNMLFKGSEICHSGSYFSYFYSHKLYSVDDGYPDISIEPVLNDIIEHDAGGQLAVVDFKLLKDTLYLLIDHYNNSNNSLYCYRYNFHTKEILSQRKITRGEFPESYDFPSIDPFDYHYIMTPIADNQILRLKVW